MKQLKYIFFIFFMSCIYIFAQNRAVQITSYKEASPANYKESTPFNYSLADSVVELKWDKSEPVGYLLGLSKGDTIAVTFDSIPKGRLDSIRIAFANPGSAVGGIWQTNDTGRSPLGKPLAVPITATITTTANVPYPVPFKNWTKVDVSSFNIKTDKPFTVAFVVGQDSIVPGFMVAKQPSKVAFHSFTYFTPRGQKPNWYYITAGTDSVYVYLIRAYVTTQFPTSVTTTPDKAAQYSLSQNYPNPFNPETLIKYSIADESFVKVKIINLLGETVAELVNAVQNAGEHSVRFNALTGNLSSGVYFYSLETNSVAGTKSYTSVKKLIYLK